MELVTTATTLDTAWDTHTGPCPGLLSRHQPLSLSTSWAQLSGSRLLSRAGLGRGSHGVGQRTMSGSLSGQRWGPVLGVALSGMGKCAQVYAGKGKWGWGSQSVQPGTKCLRSLRPTSQDDWLLASCPHLLPRGDCVLPRRLPERTAIIIILVI